MGLDVLALFQREKEEERKTDGESRRTATLLLTLGVAIPTRQVVRDWRF